MSWLTLDGQSHHSIFHAYILECITGVLCARVCMMLVLVLVWVSETVTYLPLFLPFFRLSTFLPFSLPLALFCSFFYFPPILYSSPFLPLLLIFSVTGTYNSCNPLSKISKMCRNSTHADTMHLRAYYRH